MIAEYGLIGLTLVIGALGCFFLHAARMSRRIQPADHRAFATGSAVAVAAMMTHSFVDFNLHIPANAMLLVVIVSLTLAMDRGETTAPRQAIRTVIAGLVLLIATWCA